MSCASPPQVSKTVLKAKVEAVMWHETELATVEEGWSEFAGEARSQEFERP